MALAHAPRFLPTGLDYGVPERSGDERAARGLGV